jgi:hypothetical protein
MYLIARLFERPTKEALSLVMTLNLLESLYLTTT